MLETPLSGRFFGENKRLVFAPSNGYLALIGGCIIGGLLLVLSYVFGLAEGFVELMTGLLVFLAGVWAAFSLQWIGFNLREGIYARKTGPAFAPRLTRGSKRELEAIFLLSEERLSLGQLAGRTVTYRLVLQWHGLTQPSMILEQDYRSIPNGAPLNYGAGPLMQKAARYASAIGVTVVDHSHVSTSNPIPFAPRQ